MAVPYATSLSCAVTSMDAVATNAFPVASRQTTQSPSLLGLHVRPQVGAMCGILAFNNALQVDGIPLKPDLLRPVLERARISSGLLLPVGGNFEIEEVQALLNCLQASEYPRTGLQHAFVGEGVAVMAPGESFDDLAREANLQDCAVLQSNGEADQWSRAARLRLASEDKLEVTTSGLGQGCTHYIAAVKVGGVWFALDSMHPDMHMSDARVTERPWVVFTPVELRESRDSWGSPISRARAVELLRTPQAQPQPQPRRSRSRSPSRTATAPATATASAAATARSSSSHCRSRAVATPVAPQPHPCRHSPSDSHRHHHRRSCKGAAAGIVAGCGAGKPCTHAMPRTAVDAN